MILALKLNTNHKILGLKKIFQTQKTTMLKNYFLILFRNIRRNKAFTLINVGGLTLGITCSLIMFLIVKEELSFNRFHKNVDSIYRLGHIDIVDGNEYPSGGAPLPMDVAIEEEIVGVKQSTLISHTGYGLVSVTQPDGAIKYYEETPELVTVEPNFFAVFDWELLEGSIDSNFDEPNVAVLNRSLAEKYFPGESAIGQVVKIDKRKDFKIVAVVEDAPDNSDFPFGLFMSMATLRAEEGDFGSWGSISSDNVIFLQLDNGVTQERIESQLADLTKKHWPNEDEGARTFVLSPFSEYHFDERFNTYGGSASMQMLVTYAIIGAFLIITACFNFINMSTAMAVKRAKEVGMRKVLGSNRSQLVGRFLGETFFITLISVLLSMGLTERLLPLAVNEFVDLNIKFQPLSDPMLLLYLVTILITVTLLAGLYPAMVLSSAKPINALKGTLNKGGAINLRRTLVVIQFFLCQLLIFGTIVAVKQMSFFRSVDMGYEKDWILTMTMPQIGIENQNRWEANIKQLPGIEAYSFHSRPPFSGAISGTNAYYADTDSSRIELNVQFKRGDEGYLDTYGLKMVAGDWLPKRDTAAFYVVNESTVAKMGIKDPNDAVGEILDMWGRKYPIIGVVKDFHSITLNQRIEPMMLMSGKRNYRTIGLKINAANADQIIAGLEESWYEIHPEYEFDYIFLDDNIEAFYEGEKKMSQMLTVFASIAIFIGCLGLYGLVAFIANQKAKEIGIRKVLGATVANIVKSFSWEFGKLVLIAFLIAAPVGYFGMNTWLQDYEYSITIGPLIFFASIGASVLVAFATTGYRSHRAATVNPVNSLRDQ
jgi:putative ABC transport system permease protein